MMSLKNKIKNKKVIHVLPALYQPHQYNFNDISSMGGAERFASEMALHLSQRGVNTTLLTFGRSDYSFKVDNLNIKILGCKLPFKWVNRGITLPCLRLLSILPKYDIIHLHQYFADSTLLGAIIGKLFNKHVFLTDHGGRWFNIARYFPAKYLCDKMLVQTKFEVKRFGLKRSRYQIIHAGVDLKKYKYNPNKRNKVVFVGRLLPHKGINYLIEALDTNTECIIIGHKIDQKYFHFITNLSKGKNVKFLVSITEEEKIRHIRDASVLVLPSVERDYQGVRHNNPELFGIVIAEAFASGTPVIVTNVGALPYVVDNNINGFIVPPNQPLIIKKKLNILLTHPSLVRRMGKYARKKAERLYNWDRIVKIIIKEYKI